jgi:collagenase-like PrtC family protease
MKTKKAQLRVPAGNLKAVSKAIENGADAVYIGFESPSNLRNYSGLNLSLEDAKKSAQLAHEAGKELYVVINSYPQKDQLPMAFRASEEACEIGADAVIVSDMAVMNHIRMNDLDLSIHLSVQVGATNAQSINFYRDQFAIDCVVLPRVLTLEEVAEICAHTDIEIEVFAMGSLCAGYSGRCHQSQYITGETINSTGVCTSPKFLDFQDEKDGGLTVKLNDVTINRFSNGQVTSSLQACKSKNGAEVAGTQGPDGWHNTYLVNKRHVCKGTFINSTTGKQGNILHSPIILNTLPILPQLIEAGVSALKIEGRQRPSAYSAVSCRLLREAIDLYYSKPEDYQTREEWMAELPNLFEEMTPSQGAYIGR